MNLSNPYVPSTNSATKANISATMIDKEEIQTRRSEELEALQAFYGDQLLSSLPLNNANNQEISIDGPWFIQLASSDNGKSIFVPTLEIRLPADYPFVSSDELPLPILHNADSHLGSEQKKALIADLDQMYEPEMHMDIGLLWAERCREEFIDVTVPRYNVSKDKLVESVSKELTNSSLDTKPVPIDLSIRFLSYHHLLCGKSHKKEAQLVSIASKMGLVGFVTYGTPGIIGILTSNNKSIGMTATEQDVVDFSKECNQIGKKCTVLDVSLEFDENGFKSKQANRSSIDRTSKKTSSPPRTESLHPQLAEILGEDKVTHTTTSHGIVITKKGLKAFSSCSDLKKVLVEIHGMDEQMFQQIIGVA